MTRTPFKRGRKEKGEGSRKEASGIASWMLEIGPLLLNITQ